MHAYVCSRSVMGRIHVLNVHCTTGVPDPAYGLI